MESTNKAVISSFSSWHNHLRGAYQNSSSQVTQHTSCVARSALQLVHRKATQNVTGTNSKQQTNSKQTNTHKQTAHTWLPLWQLSGVRGCMRFFFALRASHATVIDWEERVRHREVKVCQKAQSTAASPGSSSVTNHLNLRERETRGTLQERRDSQA